MKFTVSKTRGNSFDVPPCNNAFIEPFSYTDHNGLIREAKLWKIEINTLEQLIYFLNEQGECIISSGSIEIYNDYRE